MNKYLKSLFIFRRDLRLNDNTALIEALKQSKIVIACFIFDPRQVTDKNQFKSDNAIQFMIESLMYLQKQLKTKKAKLFLFYGVTEDIVEQIIKSEKLDAIFLNRDYTPFSIKRDKNIEHICLKNRVSFCQFNDLLLVEPEQIKTLNGEEYKVFTPFLKKALTLKINSPKKNDFSNYYNGHINNEINETFYIKIMPKINNKIYVQGSSEYSKKILDTISKFKNYKIEKDFPVIETTKLSAYIKFGTSSIREIYHSIANNLGKNHELIRQLFWRDFFTHIAYNNPFVFGQPFKDKYLKIKWSNDKILFEKWCKGKTGFPIIDAGMRQLNETGYIHNRVRLIVASFLVKDLHIDWQWGEKYFAQKLVDYDPAINNGNWQWVASTGSDSAPYFRIFNPWLQQKKIDLNCIYIKKWVKELKNVDAKIIHNLYSKYKIKNYPEPIIDHKKEIIKTKMLYKFFYS